MSHVVTSGSIYEMLSSLETSQKQKYVSLACPRSLSLGICLARSLSLSFSLSLFDTHFLIYVLCNIVST